MLIAVLPLATLAAATLFLPAEKDWTNPLGRMNGEGVLFRVRLLAHDDAVESIRAEIPGSGGGD